MTALVLYYSDTGNTLKVARALAERLGADLAEITCQSYLNWYGPAAMAWDIFTRHWPRVHMVIPPHEHYDLVVVGGPVWAARAAPPVMSALGSLPAADAFAVFVTCSGTSPKSPPEPALEEMRDDVPLPAKAAAIFREADIRGPSFADRIAEFAGKLTLEASA